MNEIKPITNLFGAYPNSQERIVTCGSPEAAYVLLRQNLEFQLQSRLREVVTMRYASKHDYRRAEKYLARGWTMTAPPFRGTFLSPNRVNLSRPRVTKEEAEFLGWQ